MTKPTVWMYKRPEWTNWFYKEWTSDAFGEDADQYIKIALGPVEASASGLSDEVRAVLKEAHACIGNLPDGPSDHVRQAACKEAITRILTRASATTVAEPSKAVPMTTAQREAFDRLRNRTMDCPHTYLFNPSYGDMTCKHCGRPRSAIERDEKRLQAAQQQAEPRKTLTPEQHAELDAAHLEAWQSMQQAEPDAANEIACSSCGLTMDDSKALAAIKQAEPGADERAAFEEYRSHLAEGFRPGPHSIAFDDFCAGYRAAQSGQRASVATDKPWDAAVHDVLTERTRQITHEGATPFQDDSYTEGELAVSAACYALASCGKLGQETPDNWPWTKGWWKPSGGRRDLVKAGALILAEIERIDRAANKQEGE